MSDEISDRIGIADCMARYAEAVDGHDWDLLDTVFLPDAPCDYSEVASFRGTATELKAWLAAHMPPPGLYYHLLGPPQVKLDGDVARVVTPCLNPMPVGEGSTALLGHWYRDTMVRTADGWRIADRYFSVTWRIDPQGRADDRLAASAAKQEITEALHRYCHAVDRYDRETALAVWHPDGTADYGEELYQGPVGGLIDWLWETHAGTTARSHQVTNVLIDLELDADAARSEAYVTVALQHAEPARGEAAVTVARARYIDTWSRRNGRWAIDHRRLVIDMSSTT